MQPRVQMKRRGSLGMKAVLALETLAPAYFRLSPRNVYFRRSWTWITFTRRPQLDYLQHNDNCGRIYNSSSHVYTYAGTEMTFKFYSLMGKAAQLSVKAAASSWWQSAAAYRVNTRLTCLLHINHICLLGNRKSRLHHAWTPHHFQNETLMKSQTDLVIAQGQGHADEASWARKKAHKWWRTPCFCLHINCVANRGHSCCSTTRNHMGQCGAV